MALGLGAAAWTAIVGGAGTVYSAYNANQQKKQAEGAARKQATAAQDQAVQADIANNKAQQRAPDLNTLLTGLNSAQGPSGTMLTGPSGVSNDSLSLGKTSLLGG